MKILTKYVLKEVLAHAALGTALFTFVIFMRDLGRLLELIVRNSAPLPSVAEIFFLTLPTALTITLPMGVLVGILIGLSRLAADSEVTAMRASGVGAASFVAMVSIFAVGGWLLALTNSVVVAPRSAAALVALQGSLRSSQASFAVQPRVFYENFQDYVLYVQDAASGADAAVWNKVFLAETRNPSAPKITVANRAMLINDGGDALRLHLTDGAQHETLPRSPNQYNITTFAESDLPIQLPAAEAQKRRDPPAAELTTRELLVRTNDRDPARGRWYLVEFHRRLALPTSCLVLALVGIPLGLSSRKGGKSTGFVLTILLVFGYYMVSLVGVALSRQGKVDPALGVWSANALFALAGLLLLHRVDRSSLDIGSVTVAIRNLLARFKRRHNERAVERRAEIRVLREAALGGRFPLIFDNYLIRTFIVYFGLILSALVVLMIIFTFFELLGDIIRNRVPLVTVGEYLLNVTPYLIYQLTWLCVLIATLVTLSLMNKSNELTAMKASGVSVYRIIVPLLVIAGAISAALFTFDQWYLPEANTRQEAIRNAIKGKPPQTVLRPDRKWIFGQKNVIYYYEHFDPESNDFAGLTAFEFDPATFAIVRRIYGTRAHYEPGLEKWVLENGWLRSFDGDAVREYRRFDVSTFDQIAEPPSYFKKEVRLSLEMTYGELSQYIADLSQSGFDTVPLRVQLYKKVADPLIVFVMALLAVPFALQAGRKGALTGVATALGIAIVYFMLSGLFVALGNVNQLPAMLAAWAPNLLLALAGGYLLLKVPT